jgi:hypothetical protein
MRTGFIFSFAAGLVLAAAHQGAWAAPQVLAALATDGGIPLTCAEGVCEADISTFCLQRNRPPPDIGAAYAPAAPGAFTLVVTDADGAERRLPAEAHVVFEEHRGFTAVSARLGEDVLAALGAVSARIEVAAGASLVPVPREGDPDPLTAGEIARAIGPLRALGTRVVDGSADAKAAGVLGRMVNALPRKGRVGPARRAALWGDVTGEEGLDATESPALSRAKAEYDWCTESIEGFRFDSLRHCLELRHDRLMRNLSIDYWNANVGS